MAVNPITNKIYVANELSNNVTVIDGATNATIAVPTGTIPDAVVVNPMTNKIYVANYSSDNVTVIDGATNTTTTVPTGNTPGEMAVNPVTNKIYVRTAFGVTIIDGATNNTITVPTGQSPEAVAVNPVTNKIYVANLNSNNVTVIDGATNTTTTVVAGTNPSAVGINPMTNTIYVTNETSDNVTVIDGAANTTTTVPVGSLPRSVVVDPVTNRIYAVNEGSDNVTVIDGATNTTTTVPAGAPRVAAVNSVTNKIYVGGDLNVTVIAPEVTHSVPLEVAIDPLGTNTTGSATPTFTLTAMSSFSPTAPAIEGVEYQVDTWQGPWSTAANTGGNTFSATAPALLPGVHILYAFATDAQVATSSSGGSDNSPLIGTIAAYLFLVEPAPPVFSADSPPTSVTIGTPYSYTFAATGNPAPTFALASGSLPPGLSLNATTGVLSGEPTTGGLFTFAVRATNGVTPDALSPPISIAVAAAGGRSDVSAWGYNSSGQLGNDINTDSDVPVAVPGLNKVRAIDASADHSLALLSNRTVVTWRGGGETTPESDAPVAVPGLANVAAVAAGFGDNLALLSNGKVMAWGDNGHGQLGDGTTTDSQVPVAVAGLTHVTAIAAGYDHNLALLSNGKVMAWGDNGNGELGDGTTTDSDVPVMVSGFRDVTAVAAGDFSQPGVGLRRKGQSLGRQLLWRARHRHQCRSPVRTALLPGLLQHDSGDRDQSEPCHRYRRRGGRQPGVGLRQKRQSLGRRRRRPAGNRLQREV